MIFLERMREGHRQSDEHWNRFKGNAGETSERLGELILGFYESIDTILNQTEAKTEHEVVGISRWNTRSVEIIYTGFP